MWWSDISDIKAAQQFATGLGMRTSCQHAADKIHIIARITITKAINKYSNNHSNTWAEANAQLLRGIERAGFQR